MATLTVLALLVAPSAYVAHLAWKVRRPEHLRAVEWNLSSRLGMEVTLEGVGYPRPGEMLLRGVVIRPEDSGPKGSAATELARAAAVRIIQERGQVTMEADRLVLNGPGPRPVLGLAARLLQKMGGAVREPVNLVASACRIDLGAGVPGYDLRDLAGTFNPDPIRPAMRASYRFADDLETPRCEIALTRDGGEGTPRTTLSLRTAEPGALPAVVLDPFFASTGWLGAEARVEGELTLSQAGAGEWAATFQGALRDVDLATLVGRLSPEQRLQGRATVVVDQARWGEQPGRGPGWVEAHGTLSAGAGTIGDVLLRSLAAQLQFRLSDRLATDRDAHEFQSLGLRFDFRPQSEIRLTGGLGPEFAPDAILIGESRTATLASAPDGAVSVAGLIRALVPGDPGRPDQLIPARFESLVIQRFLPAPAGPEPVQRAVGPN
jgi:hypothetical protein